MIRPHEQKRLAELSARIEAGTYRPSGEEIARALFERQERASREGFVERTLREKGQFAFGELPEPTPTESVEVFDDRAVCPEHRIEYSLWTGVRDFDCPECRKRIEARELEWARYRRERQEDFRQASGMEHDFEPRPSAKTKPEPLVFRDPLFFGLLVVLIVVACAVVFGAICDAWRLL